MSINFQEWVALREDYVSYFDKSDYDIYQAARSSRNSRKSYKTGVNKPGKAGKKKREQYVKRTRVSSLSQFMNCTGI